MVDFWWISSIFFAAPVKWLPFQSIRPGSAGWLTSHGFPQFSMHLLFWLSPGYPFNKAGKSMFWTGNKHLILIAWKICLANICCGLLSEWFWVFLSDIFLCISEWFLSFLWMICQFHRQIFLILKRRSSSLMDHSLAFCLLISGNNCPISSWRKSDQVFSEFQKSKLIVFGQKRKVGLLEFNRKSQDHFKTQVFPALSPLLPTFGWTFLSLSQNWESSSVGCSSTWGTTCIVHCCTLLPCLTVNWVYILIIINNLIRYTIAYVYSINLLFSFIFRTFLVLYSDRGLVFIISILLFDETQNMLKVPGVADWFE